MYQKLILIPSKLVSTILLLLLLFVVTLGITSAVSNLQEIDASLGLLRSQTTKNSIAYQKKIKQMLFEPVKANANPISFITGGLLAPLADILKSVVKPILGIVGEIISSAFDSVVQPLLDIVNTLFSFVDSFLDMLSQLADALSGTRVAMGFLIYRDIEGKTSKGSSNFISSKDFVTDLLLKANDSGADNFESSNFGNKGQMKKVLSDAVAWLDFMNVQRSLQSDLLGDFLTSNLGIDSLTFEDIKGQITDAVLGTACERNDILGTVPLFRDFGGFNTCAGENIGVVSSMLDQRKQDILSASASKVAQYQLKPPPDCAYSQYYEVKGDVKVSYDPKTNAGDLGQEIAKAADNIKLAEMSASECRAAANTKSDQAKALQETMLPTNLAVIAATGGSLLSQIGLFLQSFFQNMLTQMVTRFNRAISIVKSVRIGTGIALYGSLIDIAFNIRRKIRGELDTLNKEYQDYRKSENSAGN
jgi:hypothetical protein